MLRHRSRLTPAPVSRAPRCSSIADRYEQLLARRSQPALALVALQPSACRAGVQLLWDVDARAVAGVARELRGTLRPCDLSTYAAGGVFLLLLADLVTADDGGPTAAALVRRLGATRLAYAGGGRLEFNAGVATSAAGARAITPSRLLEAELQALQHACGVGVNQSRCVTLYRAPRLQPRIVADETERRAA